MFKIQPAVLILVALCSFSVRACSVPVFRYALERWENAPFQAIVFFRGELSGDDKLCVDALKNAGEAPNASTNLHVEMVDLNAAPQAKPDGTRRQLMKLWEAQKSPTLPWIVLLFPESNEELPPFWSGAPSREMVAKLLSSPARTTIARKLSEGDSVVWALLTTGDKEKDAAARKMLEDELATLKNSIALPSDDESRGGPTVRLRSELPLKIAFSIVPVSRTDPAEALFVAQLAGMDKRFGDAAQPVAYPIFGRGRALAGLVGKEFSASTIEEAATFLTGACSCQVKELNPGVDLLFDTDWEALLSGEKITEKPAPIAPAASKPVYVPLPNATISTEKTASAEAKLPLLANKCGTEEMEKRALEKRALLWIASGIVGIVVLATGARLILARKKGA